MYSFGDAGVHFQRRRCSTSPAVGVQPERYIHLRIPSRVIRGGIFLCLAARSSEKSITFGTDTAYAPCESRLGLSDAGYFCASLSGETSKVFD